MRHVRVFLMTVVILALGVPHPAQAQLTNDAAQRLYATRAQLERWVAWARANDAVILFDAAYESYISDPSLPRSIYEIECARECALELRSFSKRAGFTGVRCAFMVVPKAVTGLAPGDVVERLAELCANAEEIAKVR